MTNTSRRQFLCGSAASFFIGGCATKVAPRKIGPNQKVNVAIIGCGCIARWTGTAWESVDTGIRSDNNYDFGVVYVDTDRDWRILGATEKGPQSYNPGGEIAVWASHDGGSTWKMERQLTRGSARNQNYARQPLNVHPDFYAFWADGHGRRPSVSRLYFCDSKMRVYRLPLFFEGDFARPEGM